MIKHRFKTLRRGGLVPLLFFILWAPGIISQGGFQKYYQIPGSLNGNTNHAIEKPDGGFIVVGESDILVGDTGIAQLTLLGTDKQGNVQWQKNYGNVALDFPFSVFQPQYIFSLDTANFYVCGPARAGADHVFGMLIKLDYTGDTLWLRRFDDSSGRILPMSLTRSVDGGFYMAGTFEPDAGGRPVFVSKLDSEGHELWRKIINKSNPNVSDAKCMTQDPLTKGLIIGGYQYIGSGIYNSVLFLDSLGNKKKQLTYSNYCGGSTAGLIKLKDDNFVIGTQISVDCGNGIYRAALVKFNNDGDFLWTYEHATSGPVNGLEIIAERPNGDLVALGYIDTSWSVQAQYVVIDKSGKLKSVSNFGRKREYDFDLIRGGMVTNDGGYVTAIQLTNEPSPSRFCMIKLDSLGCDDTPANCEWERTVSLKETKQLLEANLYPNPCNEELHLVTRHALSDAGINLIDASGRLVKSLRVEGVNHKVLTSDLSSGMYLLEVLSQEGIFRANVVVQH